MNEFNMFPRDDAPGQPSVTLFLLSIYQAVECLDLLPLSVNTEFLLQRTKNNF